jgi:hypothetical protein
MLNRRVVNSAMDMMGWAQQKYAADSLNAVVNSVSKEQRAADGRLFSELMQEGWKSFKAARDKPYTPGWLEEPDDRA